MTALPDDAVVLDIREQDEWDRGHAPTAVHIPMSELPARVDELAPFLDADEPLVITCRSGGRVQRVMPWLAAAGLRGGEHDPWDARLARRGQADGGRGGRRTPGALRPTGWVRPH